uniref:KRAB domain-containing protein n=1 Tax=Castor canadensis TaxID=51338 RepID=A0A8C0XIN9_CASCN
MSAAGTQLMDSTQGSVTFEDIAIYFTQEEWEFLDEAKKLLHLDVMQENFALAISLDCEHRREDEETSVSITVQRNP